MKHLSALVLATLAFQSCDWPTPAPSPTPSVAPSPSPSPSPSPVALGTLVGVVGETVGTYFTATASVPVPDGVRAFRILQVTTLTPSYVGIQAGQFDDPLQPVTAITPGRYWLETTLTAPGTADLGLFKTATKAGPMKTMPFYMEMSHAAIGAANGQPDEGPNQQARTNLNMAYAALLRANGVEPIKQWITTFPAVKNGLLDLDTPSVATTNGTFRNLVLKGAIAPPMIFSWGTQASAATIAATAASKAAGLLPPDSWVYGFDEGQGVSDAAALAEATAYHQTGLNVMETRTWTAQFAPVVDWFWPVADLYVPGTPLQGMYVSCMSQGCSGPVHAPYGTPMMLVDAPPSHPRAVGWVFQKLGAPRGFYYSATEKLGTALQPGGMYNFNGNGDGTLVYVGTDGQPWPSLRLKRLYRGLQDAWYLAHGGVNPVASATSWPQNEAVYEVERIRAWSTLP